VPMGVRTTIRTVIATCLLWIPCAVLATDLSVRGVRIGMTQAEALASVDSKLEARKAGSPFVFVDINRIRAGVDCPWTQVDNRRPCIEFDALFGVSDNQDTAMQITMKQVFEEPIPLETFKQVVEASYGKPRMFIAPGPEAFPTAPSGSPLRGHVFPEAAWAWGGGTIDDAALSSMLMDPINGGERAKASEPLLRLYTRMHHELVYGIMIEALDPKALQPHRDVMKRAWREIQEKQAREARELEEKQGREAASKI